MIGNTRFKFMSQHAAKQREERNQYYGAEVLALLEGAEHDGLKTGLWRGFFIGFVVALVMFVLFVAHESYAADFKECGEAAVMVEHLAQARDAKMIKREQAMSMWAADMIQVGAFPPEMRWFVTDKTAEEFLYNGIVGVFDHPYEPAQQAADFLMACRIVWPQ